MYRRTVQAALAGCICATTMIGCKQPQATRPAGVPEKAVWAGGVDGGAFFLCTPSAANEANECTVYSDSTGEVYMSGSYVLRDTQRGAKEAELSYRSADGDNIYLDHDLTLVPKSGTTAR